MLAFGVGTMIGACEFSDTIVSPVELHFEVNEGFKFNPPCQWLYFEKSSTGRSANWEATTNQEWISINPEIGSVPKRVRVDANSVGIVAGVYRSEIRFTSHVEVIPSVITVTLTVKGIQPTPPEPEPDPDIPPEPKPPVPEPSPEPEDTEPPSEEKSWIRRVIDWLISILKGLHGKG